MLDKTYKFGDLKRVHRSGDIMLGLKGAEVDYVENLEGSGFKFNNPNVKSTCGCGSSFKRIEKQGPADRGRGQSGNEGAVYSYSDRLQMQ